MPNFKAVFSVGDSLARFLETTNQEQATPFACHFRLVSSADIATEDTNTLDKVVTIFLHRITTNEHLRSASRVTDAPDKQPLLYLDLHYLITYWGSGAEDEQNILTWTMQQLRMTPVLDLSMLSSGADWRTGDSVQMVPADLSLEDILRIWDALGPKYRLSISYVARAVPVERTITPELPVVATRFNFQQNGGTA